MTDSDGYVELHAASAFSFLEGGSLPDALIDRAAEIGLPAVAIADRNGVYGAARFHTNAKKRKVKAHIGAEIAVHDLGRKATPSEWLPHRQTAEPPRIVLLCASQVGYQNLCQLITRLKMREAGKAEGAATLADLEEFSAGLICLTGGNEGTFAAALQAGGLPAAMQSVEHLRGIYGSGNLYLELQRHLEREEEWRNQAALDVSESLRLPVVATNGVRYATASDREVLDVFTTIRHHTNLESAGRLLALNSERFLRPASHMHRLFRDVPEAIANTLLISRRLEFELDGLGYEFPRYPVPEGETMDSFLRKRVEEGVSKRYGSPSNAHLLPKARKQIEFELALIAKLGFAGYFLIVWDIIRYCQQHGVLVQGRGSAANSAVCYALEITAVDPVGMELLFERFLSESRGEWPDIDLDLPSGDKREEVIQYVYQRYGELGAAMTANVITYRGRSAAREVGKALGFDDDTIARLSSLVGNWEWRGPTDTMPHHFQQAGFDVRHPRIAKYLDLCLRFQDLPRHLGQHSGGMVICQGMLNRVVPIERASMVGRTVVQWDKEDCADLGLVKVDLLGLGMMAVIKDCLELIPQHHGHEVDLATLPQDDCVYKTLSRADTVGMFQVESRAQMSSLPRNAPNRFYDLVVQVALIRPGPIVGKMAHPYMRRRQGKEEVSYPHQLLEPVLKRTLGVPLFQEQLLRMAMVVANFSGTEAEELRRAVGMRRSMQRMKELEHKLRAGMTYNEIDAATQDSIIQSISSFALYGFPESHAASFALLAYASAWLKQHYLAVFTCAILNNQPMGFYSPAVLVKDAQRHGLRIRHIDIHQSETVCSVAQEANGERSLRLGLNYVKGLNRATADAIVSQRQLSGVFRTTDDLARRVPTLSKRELVQLARIGALNSLGDVTHRRDALWQVEQAGRPSGPLFNTSGDLPKAEPSPLSQMATEERLIADYGGTGLTTGPHPMSYQRFRLRAQGVLSAAELATTRNGDFVWAAGCVIARQRPGTASGFVFLSLEDETGIANIIVSPDLYERERIAVTCGKFLMIGGRLQSDDGVIHIRASEIGLYSASNVEVASHDFH